MDDEGCRDKDDGDCSDEVPPSEPSGVGDHAPGSSPELDQFIISLYFRADSVGTRFSGLFVTPAPPPPPPDQFWIDLDREYDLEDLLRGMLGFISHVRRMPFECQLPFI